MTLTGKFAFLHDLKLDRKTAHNRGKEDLEQNLVIVYGALIALELAANRCKTPMQLISALGK